MTFFEIKEWQHKIMFMSMALIDKVTEKCSESMSVELDLLCYH
jgi:hypothetical protein